MRTLFSLAAAATLIGLAGVAADWALAPSPGGPQRAHMDACPVCSDGDRMATDCPEVWEMTGPTRTRYAGAAR